MSKITTKHINKQGLHFLLNKHEFTIYKIHGSYPVIFNNPKF